MSDSDYFKTNNTDLCLDPSVNDINFYSALVRFLSAASRSLTLRGGLIAALLFMASFSAQAQTAVYRIACGQGNPVTDGTVTFAADQYFSGGSAITTPTATDLSFVNTNNQAPAAVYQSERTGLFTYTFPNLVAGEVYTVRLHFAEIDGNGAGGRVFNVAINNSTVLSNFDIYSQGGQPLNNNRTVIGPNKAYLRAFLASANSGNQIVISTSAVTGVPTISGIEIVTGFRLALGNQQNGITTSVVGPVGTTTETPGWGGVGSFEADEYYTKSASTPTVSTTVDTSYVTNPAPQGVYEKDRYGGMGSQYTFSNLIPGASYKVRLHFAEIVPPPPGQPRVFDVFINGVNVAPTGGLNVAAVAGANYRALIEEYTVNPSFQQMTIAFSPIQAATDNQAAKINGIEILSILQPGGPVAMQTISGSVLMGSGPSGLQGVTMTITNASTNATTTVITGCGGAYSVALPSSQTYTVKPAGSGYSFSPMSATVYPGASVVPSFSATVAPVAPASGLTASTPSKEYIRMNGQVIAIVNAGATSAVTVSNPASCSPGGTNGSNSSPQNTTSTLLNGFTKGNSRNNFSGFVGMQFTVGASPITVTSLGRVFLGGTGTTHIVKLVQPTTSGSANGTDIASVTVTSAGSADQFAYAPLTTAVTLSANTVYYLLSQETAGGESWYDITTVSSGNAASVQGAVYSYGSNQSQYYLVPSTASQSYVPLNLLYQSSPPAVNVTAPAAGTLSGMVTLSATATTPVSGRSIASVQFQIDGANVGVALTGSPYSTSYNTTGLSNGAHNLTALATDSAGVAASSSAVVITVSNTGAAITPLLSGFNGGAARSNYTGWVGMQFTVGSSPITIPSLGRIFAPSNTAMHTVKLVAAGSNGGPGTDVPGGSVNFSMTGTVGQFAYGNLSTPVTLSAGGSYYLMSQETAGGDQWYDIGTVTVGAGGPAIVNASVYTDASNNYYQVSGTAGYSYVPVNLLYTTTASTLPTVSITQPSGTTTNGYFSLSGTTPLTASAAAASGQTITSVQFQLNHTNIGSAITASPYTLQFDTTTVAPTTAQQPLTAIATDSAGHTSTSATVMIVINNTPPTGTPLISSFTPGAMRNNFPGDVGIEIAVGSTPIAVTALGRVYITGNTGAHTVKLVNESNGQNVTGGSAVVSMPSGATANQFVYANLTSCITLAANTKYYLTSSEASGGDQWYDVLPVTAASVVTVPGPVYSSTAGYYTEVSASVNYSYVPVSLLYSTQACPAH